MTCPACVVLVKTIMKREKSTKIKKTSAQTKLICTAAHQEIRKSSGFIWWPVLQLTFLDGECRGVPTERGVDREYHRRFRDRVVPRQQVVPETKRIKAEYHSTSSLVDLAHSAPVQYRKERVKPGVMLLWHKEQTEYCNSGDVTAVMLSPITDGCCPPHRRMLSLTDGCWFLADKKHVPVRSKRSLRRLYVVAFLGLFSLRFSFSCWLWGVGIRAGNVGG